MTFPGHDLVSSIMEAWASLAASRSKEYEGFPINCEKNFKWNIEMNLWSDLAWRRWPPLSGYKRFWVDLWNLRGRESHRFLICRQQSGWPGPGMVTSSPLFFLVTYVVCETLWRAKAGPGRSQASSILKVAPGWRHSGKRLLLALRGRSKKAQSCATLTPIWYFN